MKVVGKLPGVGLALLAVLALGLAGCASSSVFVSYPAQMQPIKRDIQHGHYAKAEEALEKHRDSADKILYMMERARTAQIGKDWQTSIADFRQVINGFKLVDDKAKISLTDTAAQGSSLLTNDNAIPYEGEGYERVFVYHFQALNFLFSKDVDAAMVEVRRANLEQRVALEEHEKELAAAEEKGREYADKNQGFMDAFAAMDAVAGKVKNSFQNAYTFYTSGVIYEIRGSANDAYIDYKKALEIFPDNVYLQRDVLRLAKQLGMTDDYALYKKRFAAEAVPIGKDEGEVIVLFEHGFAPVKLETRVGIFTGQSVQKVAFPIYPGQWQDTSALNVAVEGGKDLGNTSPIVYVQSLAAKALQEDLPAMMVRQILRVVAKKEVSEQAGKASPWAKLASDVYNIVSENADRRSWLTLPNDAQILRRPLPAGEYRLRLSNGKAAGGMKIKVVPGKKTVIRVVATENSLHTDAVVL
jgi:hypothetical protein